MLATIVVIVVLVLVVGGVSDLRSRRSRRSRSQVRKAGDIGADIRSRRVDARASEVTGHRGTGDTPGGPQRDR